MKLLRDIGLLMRRSLLQSLRNPVWVFVSLSTPLLYLALFTPLLRTIPGIGGGTTGAVLDEFLPGILALLAFGSGTGPGFSVIFELQQGVVERFRVTPTSRVALLLGPILSSMLAMFFFDGILVGVGAAFGYRPDPAGLALLAVLAGLLMATTASFSMATALSTKEISGFAAVVNGINLPVLLLAGVLLPIAFGPLWLRVLAHIDPLYYLVGAARDLSRGQLAVAATGQAFAVLVPLFAVTLTWATRVYRRAVA
jgi:ABC-2 type transport system permease protein